jgi:mono/diheme cytochrome c family protein
MKTAAVLLITALAVPAASALAQTPDPKLVATGEKLYATLKCSTCHAIKGVGGKASVPLDGVGKKLSEADLRAWLVDPAAMEAKLKAKPKVSMAGWMKKQKLTAADINALVAYMLSLR